MVGCPRRGFCCPLPGPIFFERLGTSLRGKIVLGYTLAFFLPACHYFGLPNAIEQTAHHLLLEYIPL